MHGKLYSDLLQAYKRETADSSSGDLSMPKLSHCGALPENSWLSKVSLHQLFKTKFDKEGLIRGVG